MGEAPSHSKITHSCHSKWNKSYRRKSLLGTWLLSISLQCCSCFGYEVALLYSVFPSYFPIFIQSHTSSWYCFHEIRDAELLHHVFCLRLGTQERTGCHDYCTSWCIPATTWEKRLGPWLARNSQRRQSAAHHAVVISAEAVLFIVFSIH